MLQVLTIGVLVASAIAFAADQPFGKRAVNLADDVSTATTDQRSELAFLGPQLYISGGHAF